MKKILPLVLVILLTGTSFQISKNSRTSSSESEKSFYKALSLSALQKQMKSCRETGKISKEVIELGGINDIRGFLIDDKNKDIIIIGNGKKGFPPIYTEDFIVAIRNVYLKYAKKKKNTIYYSNPGCSIDPNPKSTKKLIKVSEKLPKAKTHREKQKIFKKWEQICDHPQNVRVLGIPFNSNFAKVLVKADYDLKNIVNGNDLLNISEIKSLSEMNFSIMKKALENEEDIPVSFSQNRFWFCSGENTYLEESGLIVINNCKTILLTENEYSSNKGASDDNLAKHFANSISNNFNKLSNNRMIYKDLNNLYHLVTLAKIFKDYNSENFNIQNFFSYFLNDYKETGIPVNKKLPGKSAFREFEKTFKKENGTLTRQIWMPSCGGVDINIKPVKQNSKDGNSNNSLLAKYAPEVKQDILKSKPKKESLVWEYGISKNLDFLLRPNGN